jgi:hypothetical protein
MFEYVGEVISDGEAERRWEFYKLNGYSYLFNLNAEAVVDAIRFGNKTRFINSSATASHKNRHATNQPTANIRVKTLLVGGEHRIAFYAKHDLAVGQELMFDYGSGFGDLSTNFQVRPSNDNKRTNLGGIQLSLNFNNTDGPSGLNEAHAPPQWRRKRGRPRKDGLPSNPKQSTGVKNRVVPKSKRSASEDNLSASVERDSTSGPSATPERGMGRRTKRQRYVVE